MWTVAQSDVRQIRMLLSPAPAARYWPSGEKTTHRTWPEWPVKVRKRSPSDTRQILIVLSKLAVASRPPPGAKAQPTTQSVCPFRFKTAPDEMVHNFATL